MVLRRKWGEAEISQEKENMLMECLCGKRTKEARITQF